MSRTRLLTLLSAVLLSSAPAALAQQNREILECKGRNTNCRILRLAQIGQQETLWCWATSTQMILDWFGAPADEIRQCRFATRRRDGKINCCDPEVLVADRQLSDPQCVGGGWPRFGDLGFTADSGRCAGLLRSVLRLEGLPELDYLDGGTEKRLQKLLGLEGFREDVASIEANWSTKQWADPVPACLEILDELVGMVAVERVPLEEKIAELVERDYSRVQFEGGGCLGLLEKLLELETTAVDRLEPEAEQRLGELLADPSFRGEIARIEGSSDCLRVLGGEPVEDDEVLLHGGLGLVGGPVLAQLLEKPVKSKVRAGETNSLMWDELTAEIDAGRPVAISWRYEHGGHMMVAAGYLWFSARGTTERWVLLHDPWPPQSGDALLVPYEMFVTGPVSGHWRDYWNIRPEAEQAEVPAHPMRGIGQPASVVRERRARLERGATRTESHCDVTERLRPVDQAAWERRYPSYWEETAGDACKSAVDALAVVDDLWTEGLLDILPGLGRAEGSSEDLVTLGLPLPVIDWTDNIEEKAARPDRFIFPIVLSGEVISSVTVSRGDDGRWQIESVGRSNLVEGLEKARQSYGHMVKEGEGVYLIQELTSYQLFLTKTGEEQVFVPVYSDPALGFEQGVGADPETTERVMSLLLFGKDALEGALVDEESE